jgi:tetratricopeptide (TPR) repeat protein
MKRMGFSLSLLVCLLLVVSACSRNPEVKKKKYLESGQRYFEQEKYNEAAIQFSNAIQVDNKFADAHYQLSRALLKLGQWRGGYSELQRTVELQPDNMKAQLDLGNVLLAARKFPEADEKVELVLGKEPNNVDAMALSANIAAAQGKPDESLELIKKAIQLDPRKSQLYTNLAILQLNARKAVEAEESLKKAAELDSKSAAPLLMLAEYYQGQQRVPEAEQYFQKAVQAEPQKLNSRVMLARFYLMQGKRGDAEQVVVQAKRDLANDPKAYRSLADFYLSVGDVDKALTEFAALYKDHPKDAALARSYAELLLNRRKFDEAGAVISELLRRNRSDVDAMILQGRLQLAQNNPKDAINSIQGALKTEPDSAPGHFYLGVAFDVTGENSRAEAEWRESSRLRPDYIEAQRALGTVAARKNDLDLLSQSAAQIIRLQPFDPSGYIMRASAELGHKENEKAEADLQKAIEVAPKNPIGYIKLAEFRASQKNFVESEKYFQQALHFGPNLEALQGLSGVYVAQKQAAKAMALLNQAIVADPNSSGLHTVLGSLQANNKDLSAAEVSFQKAVDLEKKNTAAYAALFTVQVGMGAKDKALATAHTWFDNNPSDVRGCVAAGGLEQQKGNLAEAERLYQKALQIVPDYPPAANNLAYLMLQRGGNIDVALSLAQTAVRGMPDSPNAADTLGWAYYNKGAYPSAVEALEQAARRVPNNAEYRYHLGLAYQKNNNLAKAKVELEKVLQLDPKFPQAKEVRENLDVVKRS